MTKIVKISKSNLSVISDNDIVKVTSMGDIIELMQMNYIRSDMPFKKLDNDNYMLYETGEVLQFEHSTTRADDKDGLRVTFKKIRNYINTNFHSKDNELHIVLTYAENMTDTKQLYKDFDKFWKKFTYKYTKQCEYAAIIEPQARGAWHLHLLIKLPKKQFINNNEVLEPMWGHGWTKIKSLDKIDNIGAYLSAYLGDIELTDDMPITAGQTIKLLDIDGQKKAFIKGGRLHLYPPKMNIFRHSKGIKSPTSEMMSYKNAKKIVGAVTPNYSSTIIISDENDKLLNKIVYEQYNKKRLKNQ